MGKYGTRPAAGNISDLGALAAASDAATADTCGAD